MTRTQVEPAPAEHRAGPLRGMRVVELSSYVATPLCGLTLAQLGAEVIRVEPLGGGPDRGRWPLSESGTSHYWNGLNAGKKTVAVDLADPAGRELVADLVCEGGGESGILVTNTERWPELRHDALRRRRPDVVHVLLTGRYDGSTAVDYTVQAGSGFPLVTGPGDHAAPVNHLLPAWDFAAGLHLATGLLAALRHRALSGEGAEVRLGLEDVALTAAGHLGYLAEAQERAETPRAADGNYVYGTFGRDFTSRDGARFMVVALTPRQWRDLLGVTGTGRAVGVLAECLGADFSDEGERYRHRELLASLVQGWFGRHTRAEVECALAGTRVLWSPYRTFGDLVSPDGELRGHPAFGIVEQPGVGSVLAAGSAITVDGRRGEPRAAAAVGEHSEQVLQALPGMTPERLSDLVARGVVQTRTTA